MGDDHHHGHNDDAQHDHSDDTHEHDHHHGQGESSLTFAILTVTSTRDTDTDESGTVARDLLDETRHEVTEYDTVPDEVDAIRGRVREAATDVVVTTGGTGLTPDDVTVEAVRPLFDREIPGFGEYFRRLSHDEVGTPAMLSRATAGVVDGTVIYALPGNPNAVELGISRAVLPEVDHAVTLSRRD